MIAVVGDLLVDIFLLPSLREAEQGDGVLLRSGGSAANTAAWLSHLGHPTVFVGCTAAGGTADFLVKELRGAGVDLRLREVPHSEMGAVVIQVDHDGERVMRSSRGANQALDVSDVQRAILIDPTVLHLTGYALLGPSGLQILQAAGEVARDCGALLSFDPSSCAIIDRFGADTLLAAIRKAGVQVLLPNSEESVRLTSLASPEAAAKGLGHSVRQIFVKDGAGGAFYWDDGHAGRLTVEPVRPVDTTGAGDAFNAGVLATLYGAGDPRVACAKGHECALEVLLRYGGRPMGEVPTPLDTVEPSSETHVGQNQGQGSYDS